MGKSREQTTVVQSGTSTPTPTPEETRLNQLEVQRQEQLFGPSIDVQRAGLDLTGQLLRGREDLPGFFGPLAQGISPDVTQSIVGESLRDVNTQLAASGAGTFLESGASQAIGGRVAGDVRRAAEEFNIGNRLNLLNLALSGQAQVQQPVLGFAGQLSNRLAGLRSVATTGTTTQTAFGPSFGQQLSGAFAQRLGGAQTTFGGFKF